MPFSKKQVKGQKRKLQYPFFLGLYVVNTIVWLFCESETCAFFRPVWLFCYAPKRCSPCSEQMFIQIQCTFHHGHPQWLSWVWVITSSYQRYNHIQNVCLSSIPKKKECSSLPCFDLKFAAPKYFIKVLISPSVELECMWSWIKLSYQGELSF